MASTVVEKILARAAGRDSVRAGEVVAPAVDLALSHENAALVISQFREMFEGTGRTARPWDPARIAIVFDHRVPAESARTATNHSRVRTFVAGQAIEKFHDVRGDVGGICHQVLPEYGYVRPGDRRHRDGGRVGARRPACAGGPGNGPGGGWRTVRPARRAEGPRPPPGVAAGRRGGQLPRAGVPRAGAPRAVVAGPRHTSETRTCPERTAWRRRDG